MTDDFETRWQRGPEFAEAAEALKLRTDQIMGVGIDPDLPEGHEVAFYTRAPGERPEVLRRLLARDADGILRPVGREVKIAGFWYELDEAVGDSKLPRSP
jgi:hypothetical protein